jgi:predicted Zn-dependent peptidase
LRRVLLSSIVALGLIAPFARADDGPAKVAEALGERRRSLENGLELVVLPSSRARAVVVVTAFRAGPRDETKDEAGISQLVARLYRKASAGARASGAADMELASLATPLGNAKDLVGFEVKHDAISFFATAPEDKLQAVLDVEKDRLTALAPSPELLEDVRSEAVFQSASVEGKTATRAWNTLLALAYGDCGLGRSRFGSSRAISGLGFDKVDAWRRAHFRPDAALVVIAGAHDPEGALEKAAKTLGAIPKPGDALAARPATPPCPPGPLRATIEGAAAAREVLVAFRGPDPGSDDEAAFLTLGLEVKDRVVAALRGAAHEQWVKLDADSDSPALLYARVSPKASVGTAEIESRTTAAVASLVGEEKLAPAALAALQKRVGHVLQGLTRPVDAALVGRRNGDDLTALVEAASDRASSEPLVRRREAIEKRLATLTPDGLRDAAHFYLAPERERVVVVGDK